ncbi:MAG: cell envelope integrity protein CreD [Flavobacteriales bacterium]
MSQDQTITPLERTQRWLRESLTVKLFIIGFIILLLLIPLAFVHDLVREREERQREAEHEVANTWGTEQTFTGPFLTIPYYESHTLGNGLREVNNFPTFAHFLPDVLDVNTELQTEIRSRGIFDVVVYTAIVKMTGSFSKPDMQSFTPYETVWNNAQLQLGLSDLRNLADLPQVQFGNESLSLQPGLNNEDLAESGLAAPVIFSESDDKINFSITLRVRGSRSIQLIPLGKETTAHISGNWGSPSFQGSYLPEKKDITQKDFSANWKLLYMNRPYPQQFAGDRDEVRASAFGVDLKLPITDYQKNERSAKYAVLIIALTFIVFFFVQVLHKVRIHGIQFMLAGLALCLFYVLLLSFTEHVGFNMAYFIAGLLTIGLITLYIKAIFKNSRLTVINFLLLTIVYGFVFVIIQLEEYALLVGSLGLFLVLAVTMYLSRNITWSEQMKSKE